MHAEPQSFHRVLSSMCTKPLPAARDAAVKFLGSNPGDPSTFPAIAELETEAIESLGEIAQLDDPSGYITSGGTEANIQALRIAQSQYRAQNDGPGNVVVPETAHFSFAKAAEILDLELRWIPTSSDYTVDLAALRDAVDHHTVAIVGVAGSTKYGRVDPIPELGEIATQRNILFHVDAAWGGFALPFTDYSWSFTDAPIDTMTIDPHKMGRAPIPAGGLLTRTEQLCDALRTETPYLETTEQISLTGTRSGAGVAGAATALDALWPAEYKRMAADQQATARWLADQLQDRGYTVIEPWLPLVPVKMDATTVTRLQRQGWRISRTPDGFARIVCMPHINQSLLQSFLNDLDAVVADHPARQG